MASSNAPIEEHQSVDTNEHRYEVAPDESPTEAVLTAVAEATGRPVTPSETADSESGSDPLPPLFETINPDALDTLADSKGEQGNCLVTFTYGGCTVSMEEQVVTVTTQT